MSTDDPRRQGKATPHHVRRLGEECPDGADIRLVTHGLRVHRVGETPRPTQDPRVLLRRRDAPRACRGGQGCRLPTPHVRQQHEQRERLVLQHEASMRRPRARLASEHDRDAVPGQEDAQAASGDAPGHDRGVGDVG